MTSLRLEAINLNLLLALDALLEEGNVTRAAARVGIGQPAMSKSLGTLRELFADELLTRVGNEMRATPLAEALAPELRRAIADLRRVVRTAGPFVPADAHETLRIATPGHLAALAGPRLLARLHEQAPGVTLRIEDLPGSDPGRAIEAGADLALGPAKDDATLASRVLARDGFACLLRRNHPAGASFSLDTYLTLRHLVISPTGRGTSFVDEALGERVRTIAARVQSFVLAPTLVAESDLVLTAPRSALLAAARTLPVELVEAPLALPAITLAAYWDPRRDRDARTQWLLRLLGESLRAELDT